MTTEESKVKAYIRGRSSHSDSREIVIGTTPQISLDFS
jgi:hypothetical protein